jgi:hypothetical protein
VQDPDPDLGCPLRQAQLLHLVSNPSVLGPRLEVVVDIHPDLIPALNLDPEKSSFGLADDVGVEVRHANIIHY